LEKSH